MGASNSPGSRESKKRWHRENFVRSREITRAWKAANPGAIAKYNIAYKSTTKKQTPKWADMTAINEIYRQAQERGMTVDHIVPLRGRSVCGLHVHYNLNIVTHEENAAKGNRF